MTITNDFTPRPVPQGFRPEGLASPDTQGAAPAGSGTVEAEVSVDHVPKDALAFMPGNAPGADVDSPENPMPSPSDIKAAFDSIDWENPSLGTLMKVISMITASMRKAQNEAKWALQESEMKNLMNEVANMIKAATTEMVTTIATSVASIGLNAVNLGASTRAISQTKGLADDIKAIDLTDANSQKVLKGLDADLNLVNLKSTRVQTGTQIAEGVSKVGGAIGSAQAGYINADAKEDAAQAQRAASYKQAAQSAEEASRDELRAVRDMLQDIIRTMLSTENKIANNF
jgi:hypothetical protein